MRRNLVPVLPACPTLLSSTPSTSTPNPLPNPPVGWPGLGWLDRLWRLERRGRVRCRGGPRVLPSDALYRCVLSGLRAAGVDLPLADYVSPCVPGTSWVLCMSPCALFLAVNIVYLARNCRNMAGFSPLAAQRTNPQTTDRRHVSMMATLLGLPRLSSSFCHVPLARKPSIASSNPFDVGPCISFARALQSDAFLCFPRNPSRPLGSRPSISHNL